MSLLDEDHLKSLETALEAERARVADLEARLDRFERSDFHDLKNAAFLVSKSIKTCRKWAKRPGFGRRVGGRLELDVQAFRAATSEGDAE